MICELRKRRGVVNIIMSLTHTSNHPPQASSYISVTNRELFYIFAEKILSQIEKQRYDGYYNNLAHPEWGAVGEYKHS